MRRSSGGVPFATWSSSNHAPGNGAHMGEMGETCDSRGNSFQSAPQQVLRLEGARKFAINIRLFDPAADGRGWRVELPRVASELDGYPASISRTRDGRTGRSLRRVPGARWGPRSAVKEAAALKSRIATSKKGRGGARHLPYAFTEHGAIRRLMEPPPDPPKDRIGFRPRRGAADGGSSGARGTQV